jgi:predicted adenine nucleotide alpha hydrolase (AANH) superfamily ATPase
MAFEKAKGQRCLNCIDMGLSVSEVTGVEKGKKAGPRGVTLAEQF